MSISNAHHLINRKVISDTTLTDLRVTTNALVSWKNMEKRKANILLELWNIIVKYPNTKEYIEQKLHEKCKREGVSIDMVILFF